MARTNTNTGSGSGTIGGSISNNQVGYGTGANTLGSDANFLRNLADDRFSFASNVDASFGIFYNGTGAPNALGNHAGLGIDFRAGSVAITLGWVGFGNETRLEIADNATRVDLYTQDFYVRGYNANIGIFAEVTGTYADVTIGDGSSAYGGDRIQVENSVNRINVWTDGVFRVRNVGNTGDYLLVDPANDDYAIGDLGGLTNSNLIWIQDDASIISVRTPGTFQVTNPSNVQTFAVDIVNRQLAGGDVGLAVNGTRFLVSDLLQTVDFAAPGGEARFGDIDNLGNGTLFSVEDSIQEIIVTRPIRLAPYTVATLPVGSIGDTAYVNDALGPVFGSAVVGGGAAVVPVFRNATIWIVG